MKKTILSIACALLAISVYAQTTTADDYYMLALQANHKGDYQTARENLKKCLESDDATFQIKEYAQQLYDRLDEFEVSSHEKWNIAPDGGYREFVVTSVGGWQCDTVPEWCHVEEMHEKYLKVWCGPNPDRVSRSGKIILSSESGKSVEVDVEQDMGNEKAGRIIFKTSPHEAYIETEGANTYSLTPLMLPAGEHKITISKQGYISRDTTLVFAEAPDSTVIIDIELEPEFAMLKPVILDENGNPWLMSDMENLVFKIGSKAVDLSDYSNSSSFDDRGRIDYVTLYKEGVIPLHPAEYAIEVTAPGYATVRERIKVERGEVRELEIEMNSITGTLQIVNGVGAEDAIVTIPQLFVHAKDGETLKLMEGTYDVFVNKEGYRWADDRRQVTIKQGKTQKYEVNMTRQVDLRVSTIEDGARVYLNGTQIFGDEHHIDEGQAYRLEVKKDGYWHVVKEFEATKKDTLFDFSNLEMVKTVSLNMRSDEPALLIDLKKKGDPSEYNYAEGKSMSKEVKKFIDMNIPSGKYHLTLTRTQGKSYKPRHLLAYKGVINVKDSIETRFLRTWMVPKLGAVRFLGVDYDLTYKSAVASGMMPTPLKVNFMEIPLFRGLSTSLAKGALVYTGGLDNFPAHLPLDYYTVAMPAFSGPLMNYDFRMGGGLGQWFDLSMMLSYTYYLQFDKILKKNLTHYYSGEFDHFEGHDLFLGLELSSRLSGFNGYIRAGYQMLKGDRCYSYSDYLAATKPGYYGVHVLEFVPSSYSAFIVTVGFDLGVKSAKGHNICRIF